MTHPRWFDELSVLAARFAHTGVSDDLASLSMLEAWHLLRFLRRLVATQARG